MMNVQIAVAACLIAAYLAGMLIALLGLALLASPVWAIGARWKGAARPMWVVFATAVKRHLRVLAFWRTEVATTILNLKYGCLVLIATMTANPHDSIFRFLGSWARTARCILRTTLLRAKAGMAICPVLKCPMTPIANKPIALGLVCQSIGAALGRTEAAALGITLYFKKFTACLAGKCDALTMGKMPTVIRAVFLVPGLVGVAWFKRLAAKFTGFYHPPHYTLDCTGWQIQGAA